METEVCLYRERLVPTEGGEDTLPHVLVWKVNAFSWAVTSSHRQEQFISKPYNYNTT